MAQLDLVLDGSALDELIDALVTDYQASQLVDANAYDHI